MHSLIPICTSNIFAILILSLFCFNLLLLPSSSADESKSGKRKMVVEKWCESVKSGVCKNMTLYAEHPYLSAFCQVLEPWCNEYVPRTEKDYDEILEKLQGIQGSGLNNRPNPWEASNNSNSSLSLLPSASCKFFLEFLYLICVCNRSVQNPIDLLHKRGPKTQKNRRKTSFLSFLIRLI